MKESASLDVTRKVKINSGSKVTRLQEVKVEKKIYKSLQKAVKIISLETDVLKVLDKELEKLKILLDKLRGSIDSRATTKSSELGRAILHERIKDITKSLLTEADFEKKYAVDLDRILAVIEKKLNSALKSQSLIGPEKELVQKAVKKIDFYKNEIKRKFKLIYDQIRSAKTKQDVIELHGILFNFYNQELLPLRVLVLEVEKKIAKTSSSNETDLRKNLLFYLNSLERELLVISHSTIQGYTELILEMRTKILYLKHVLGKRKVIQKGFIAEIEKHIFTYLDKIITKLETEQESWIINEIMASVIKAFLSIIITAKDLRLSITKTLYWNKNKESKILLQLLNLVFVLNQKKRINLIWFNFTINHLSTLGNFYPQLRKETKIIIYRTKNEDNFYFG